MSMEWLRQLLDALWDKLKIIFERALDAPEIIRAWSEGRASFGDRDYAQIYSRVSMVASISNAAAAFIRSFLISESVLRRADRLRGGGRAVLFLHDRREPRP